MIMTFGIFPHTLTYQECVENPKNYNHLAKFGGIKDPGK